MRSTRGMQIHSKQLGERTFLGDERVGTVNDARHARLEVYL